MVPVFSFLVPLCVRRDIRPTKLQRDDFFFRYFCFAPIFLPTVRPFPRFDVLTLCIFCWLRIASFRRGRSVSIRANGFLYSADSQWRIEMFTVERERRHSLTGPFPCFIEGKASLFPRQVVCFPSANRMFCVVGSIVFCRQVVCFLSANARIGVEKCICSSISAFFLHNYR